MAARELVVIGVARNAQEHLLNSLSAVEKFAAAFDRSHLIFVTNDNSDQTAQDLKAWCGANPRRQLIELDGIASALPERTERIAFARNAALIRAWSIGVPDSALVLMVDMDGPNTTMTFESLLRAIQSDGTIHWSGLFPNSSPAYYDVYALRHPTWCPDDCWAAVEGRTRFPFRNRKRRQAIAELVFARQYSIPHNLEMIEVDSAFGGAGLYRASEIRGCWYSGRETNGDIVCEHVAFNRAIRRRGGKLFVLPSWRNLAPAEHLGFESGRLFPAEQIGFELPRDPSR